MTAFKSGPTLARTNAREPYRLFGIKPADRFSHVYAIGKTGVGKSTLIRNLIGQDINSGRGCALVDPHGDLVASVAAIIPEDRQSDLFNLDLSDPAQPYSYNPLASMSARYHSLVASGLMDILKKLWKDAWGVRMEHILRNTILTLLAQPEAHLPDILRLLSEQRYRREAVARLDNVQVKQFWVNEYEKYPYRYRAEGNAPIQNKIGALLADPLLHRIFTRTDGQIRLRSIMDEGKILLVNLAKGRIGDDSASLLGGFLVTSLGLAAYSRANVPEYERAPFFIYIDEFQNFTTLALANMLSELRKFGVGMMVAHQYLYQIEPEIRHAVLGNVGTVIAFRIGPEDAGFLAREFEPRFSHRDLMNLSNYDIILKLMIDGTPSRPFSATTLPTMHQ